MPETYEPEGGNTPAPRIPPAAHHVRPALLVLLGVSIIVVLGGVVLMRSFVSKESVVSHEKGREATAQEPSSMAGESVVREVHTPGPNTQNPIVAWKNVIAGKVTEVDEREGVKQFTLVTDTPQTSASGVKAILYLFRASADIDGTGTIAEGSNVVLFLDDEPSSTEYVSIKKVQVLR